MRRCQPEVIVVKSSGLSGRFMAALRHAWPPMASLETLASSICNAAHRAALSDVEQGAGKTRANKPSKAQGERLSSASCLGRGARACHEGDKTHVLCGMPCARSRHYERCLHETMVASLRSRRWTLTSCQVRVNLTQKNEFL